MYKHATAPLINRLRGALLLALTLLFAPAGLVAQTAELAVTVIDERGQPVADVVIVAVPAGDEARPPKPAGRRPNTMVVDQVNGEFSPKVRAIFVGDSVRFPNHDNIRHQVYSFSPTRRFELPLYPGVAAPPIRFDTAGVVVLGCNIHEWMVGYVYVSESPYFARTNESGKARLQNLPQRAYVVRVWHPQLSVSEAATKKRVDVSHAARAAVDWTLTLKPEVRARRTPAEDRSGAH